LHSFVLIVLSTNSYEINTILGVVELFEIFLTFFATLPVAGGGGAKTL
jgi:hypothetical protein